MAKFKFKTKKGKNKFNFITDDGESLKDEIIKGAHVEFFSNQKMILDGCESISDYQNTYIKLKLKNGYISVLGTNFLISDFENGKITVKGKILSVEFCI